MKTTADKRAECRQALRSAANALALARAILTGIYPVNMQVQAVLKDAETTCRRLA